MGLYLCTEGNGALLCTEGNVVQCIQKAMELQMYTEGNGVPNVYRRQWSSKCIQKAMEFNVYRRHMSYDICYQNAMKLYLCRLKWEIYWYTKGNVRYM